MDALPPTQRGLSRRSLLVLSATAALGALGIEKAIQGQETPFRAIPSGATQKFGGVAFTANTPNRPYSLLLGNGWTRHELHQGDQWSGDVGPTRKERSELTALGFPMDTELWSALSMTATNLPKTWTVLVQLHQRPEVGGGRTEHLDGKPPPFDVRVEDGQFKIGVRGDKHAITTDKTIPDLHVVYNDRWRDGEAHDFVFRTRLHWTHGELQVWRDGVELCNEKNLSFGYNDDQSVSLPAFAIGLYRQRAAERSVVEFAGIQPPTTKRLHDRIDRPRIG